MPYIGQRRADEHRRGQRQPANVGDLTWAITRLVVDYMRHKGLSYQVISDVRAALYGTGREFDRRVADPYEDSVRAGSPGGPLPVMIDTTEKRDDPYAALRPTVDGRNALLEGRRRVIPEDGTLDG